MRLAVLLLVTACGRLGFDAVGGGGDDTLDDGGLPGEGSSAMVDASMTTTGCTQPGGGSTFPGGQPCADWAANASVVNAGLSESAGELRVTPNPNTAGAQGGCLKNGVPFGAAGAIVEVTAALTGNNCITAIQLGGGATALSMVVQNGMLLAQDAAGTRGMIAYSSTAKRFWRIRPAGAQILFEYSDGTQWTELATSSQTAPATYDIRLIAGEIGGVANPGEARFASVNLCP